MAEAETILIVDDEEEICQLVSAYLEQEDFRVLTALDGAAMWDALAKESVNLIVLDVRLPDQDGFSLVKELRRTHDTPVILLTGKSDPVDRIVGLEIGADDYLGKPFELRELLARIRSVLRRAKGPSDPRSSAVANPVKVFAGWSLDEVHRQLFSPSGTEVELTAAEFALLKELVNNPQQPVGRHQLLQKVQSRDWTPEDRSIDVSVSRLRKKLEEDPAHPVLIKTVRNAGYVLASIVESRAR